MSGSASVSDNSAFSVASTYHTVIIAGTSSNGLKGGYYTYSIKALKTGTYTISGRATICKKYDYSVTTSGTNYWAKETESGSFTCTVTVVDVTSISIPSSISVQIGSSYTFTPVITDSRAKTTLTWQSSNPGIASVANGVVTPYAVGTTVITCYASNGVSAQCTVTVTPLMVSSITLSQTSAELTENEQLQLTATAAPANATNKTVNWTSSNPSVATVSNTGLVTASGTGDCTIMATAADGSGASATCAVKVIGDVLYTDNAVAVPSGTFTLPIQLKNQSAITAFQFELALPEGVSVVTNSAGKYAVSLSERAVDHTISCSLLSNGNYQIVILSGNAEQFAGNTGAVAYVTLNVGTEVAVGSYGIGVKNVELTTVTNQAIHHKDMTSQLTIMDVTTGDVNGDEKITVTDAVGIVNYILERTPSSFIPKAADVNGDGEITITDAVSIVNIILNN